MLSLGLDHPACRAWSLFARAGRSVAAHEEGTAGHTTAKVGLLQALPALGAQQ